MARTVVTGAKHLEELAPTPAKLGKLRGYDTLDPDETRAYIAEVLRIYSKQNKPYKIRSRRNPISDFKTTWKIKHDGKHIGDINLETHKPHGVGFGYGISKGIIKHEQRRWYTAHVKMVAHHVKARIDLYFKVGVWWDIRGIPSNRKKREEWLRVYKLITKQEQDYVKDFSYGDADSPAVLDRDMLERLKAEGVTYGIRTLQKIRRAGHRGYLDHLENP